MLDGDRTRECSWEARRDSADFTGTWEWLALTNTPVQLKIERRDGRLIVSDLQRPRRHATGNRANWGHETNLDSPHGSVPALGD